MTTYREPAGPGVRVDSGIEPNSVIGGAFDSLLAKLVVYGETRTEALERARRALDEYVVEGMATALPFHRAVVRDEAFTSEPFTIFTRWIETEFDNQIPPFSGGAHGLAGLIREGGNVPAGGAPATDGGENPADRQSSQSNLPGPGVAPSARQGDPTPGAAPTSTPPSP